MSPAHRKYTYELLADAVARATSVAGVLRILGLNQAGGTHAHISRTIKRFGIDTSHFVRFNPASIKPRLPADQILVRRRDGAQREKPHMLKRALVEIGRPYACEVCSNGGEWHGAALRLHVDHIDGDFLNNSQENLRFLCPNCHSQTANYCSGNRGRRAQIDPAGPEPRPA